VGPLNALDPLIALIALIAFIALVTLGADLVDVERLLVLGALRPGFLVDDTQLPRWVGTRVVTAADRAVGGWDRRIPDTHRQEPNGEQTNNKQQLLLQPHHDSPLFVCATGPGAPQLQHQIELEPSPFRVQRAKLRDFDLDDSPAEPGSWRSDA